MTLKIQGVVKLITMDRIWTSPDLTQSLKILYHCQIQLPSRERKIELYLQLCWAHSLQFMSWYC